MTRDDIIRMSQEADDYADNILCKGEFHPDWHDVRDHRFAELVAAAEREECAKVCEAYDCADPLNISGECAERIRLKGDQS